MAFSTMDQYLSGATAKIISDLLTAKLGYEFKIAKDYAIDVMQYYVYVTMINNKFGSESRPTIKLYYDDYFEHNTSFTNIELFIKDTEILFLEQYPEYFV